MKDDQRVALTKRLLREGLLRLLEKKDIDSIKVSELCEESGINRATFYRHYGQPADILKNLRLDIMEDVEKIAKKDNAEVNLLKWLEDICQYFYEHSDLLRMLFKTRTDNDFVFIIKELYSNHIKHIYSKSDRCDEESLKLSTFFYAGGFYYILRQWILEPIDKTPKEIAGVMYEILNRGPELFR